jgi:hypothetical protein
MSKLGELKTQIENAESYVLDTKQFSKNELLKFQVYIEDKLSQLEQKLSMVPPNRDNTDLVVPLRLDQQPLVP